MPATTVPSTRTGIPPAPGNNASGDAWANPAATGGAIDDGLKLEKLIGRDMGGGALNC